VWPPIRARRGRCRHGVGELLGGRLTQLGERLLGGGVLDREDITLAVDLLATDQQPRLHGGHLRR
jgi:hypothetical protein